MNKGLLDYLFSAAACFLIAAAALVWQPDLVHWGTLVAAGCGVLTGAEISAWVRKKGDPFDISFLIGIVGFVGFFISPLILLSSGDQLVIEGVKISSSRKMGWNYLHIVLLRLSLFLDRSEDQ